MVRRGVGRKPGSSRARPIPPREGVLDGSPPPRAHLDGMREVFRVTRRGVARRAGDAAARARAADIGGEEPGLPERFAETRLPGRGDRLSRGGLLEHIAIARLARGCAQVARTHRGADNLQRPEMCAHPRYPPAEWRACGVATMVNPPALRADARGEGWQGERSASPTASMVTEGRS